MDAQVLKAMAKWPNVPALYGWLELDRRGHWLIQGETIGRPQIRNFLARNYHADEHGRWYFQNGPQRVFVNLEYMPVVLRVHGETLTTHSGQLVARPQAAYLDEEGTLLVVCEHGPALLDYPDLPWALERITTHQHTALRDEDLECALALPSGEQTALQIELCRKKLPLARLDAASAPDTLGFQRVPMP